MIDEDLVECYMIQGEAKKHEKLYQEIIKTEWESYKKVTKTNKETETVKKRRLEIEAFLENNDN